MVLENGVFGAVSENYDFAGISFEVSSFVDE